MNNPNLPRVQQVVADLFNLSAEQITVQSSPDTIESWDSLQHLNLVLALEQEFGVQFAPEEIETMNSVERILAVLSQKS